MNEPPLQDDESYCPGATWEILTKHVALLRQRLIEERKRSADWQETAALYARNSNYWRARAEKLHARQHNVETKHPKGLCKCGYKLKG